jgi:YgiT-type zinc finger domain-containing protein
MDGPEEIRRDAMSPPTETPDPPECCHLCRGAMAAVTLREHARIGALSVEDTVPGYQCGACGEQVVDACELGRFERRVAHQLLLHHVRGYGPALRYARKALGLSVDRLAALLCVDAAAVRAWEREPGSDGNAAAHPHAPYWLVRLLEDEDGTTRLLERTARFGTADPDARPSDSLVVRTVPAHAEPPAS